MTAQKRTLKMLRLMIYVMLAVSCSAFAQTHLPELGKELKLLIPPEGMSKSGSAFHFDDLYSKIGETDLIVNSKRVKFFIASHGKVRFFDENDELIAERSFINEDDGRIIVSNNAQYVIVLNYLAKSISLRDIDNKQIWQRPLPTRLFRRGRSVRTQPILTTHGLFIDPLTNCLTPNDGIDCENERIEVYRKNGNVAEIDILLNKYFFDGAFAVSPEGKYLAFSCRFSRVGTPGLIRSPFFDARQAGTLVALYELRTRTLEKLWQRDFNVPSIGDILVGPDAHFVVSTTGRNEVLSGEITRDFLRKKLISIIDKSGEIVREFGNNEFGEMLNAEALSADGRFFAFTSVREENAHLYLADILQDGTIAWHYSGVDDGIKQISSVSIANDGQNVAAVCSADSPYQRHLLIWDKDGKTVYQKAVEQLSYSKISSDGLNLWAATTDGKLFLYGLDLQY